MTLTVRSATVTGATTKGSPLTHAEMDANFAHVIDSSNQSFVQSGSGAIARTVSAKLQETVSVLDFIPVAKHAGIAAGTNTDDLTTYFDSALATGKRIFAPAGTYYVNVTDFSTCYLYGEGEATVIRAKTTTASTLKCLSGGSSDFITGVVVRDLKLYGTVEADGFHASPALIDFTGVKRCRIENVYFEGFRLDGIYLGGNVSAAEYHNVDVVIKNCVFDGVNNGGRNGISVIDVDGLEIEGCAFRNCAKSDQPGSLDFEPNQSFSVIKNVRVVNNSFTNTDGNRGHICIQTHNTTNVENIVIKGNHLEDVTLGDNIGPILINTSDTTPTTPQRIIIEGNTIDCTGTRGIKKRDGEIDGLIIRGNIISALTPIWLTFTGAQTTTRNVVIEGNIIYGEATSTALILNEIVAEVSIKGNIFKGTPTNHIQIAGTSSTGVSIVGNDFSGTPSNTDITHSSTTKNATTNLCALNRFVLGTQTFKAVTRDNTGFVTENSGTASITSGATTAVVSHGLSVTPTLDDISIVFGEQGTNDYGRWSVGTLTSTQFTLTVAADPGASNLDFAWKAQVTRAIT